MSARTVITHALNQGTHALPVGMRARYTGSQSWGPATVTVVKPWGGRIDPLYVVVPDGMDARFTYVVAESELSPVGGVSLAKEGDPVRPVPAAPTGPIRTTGDGWVSYVPRGEWSGLIRAALRHSQYAYASGLSAAFHAEESA